MTPYLQQKTLYAPQIYKRPSLNLGIVVVIPVKEEQFLQLSLMSLQKSKLGKKDVEVILIINDSEADAPAVKKQNQETYEKAREWASKNSKPRLKFYVLYFSELPARAAGVGLARKIGMDEACWRLEKIRNTRGVIACFDADSRCQSNYFQELESHFQQHPKLKACSIYFEHPLHGASFDESIYRAIVQYELHLRYYIHAQRYAGFPYAVQTIGSSMAVRCNAYQQQGGMNKRKAGEDFYFLHKFTPLGGFKELKTTTVIPSPRPSHRVPFGTGKAIDSLLKSKDSYQTYAPQSFQDLKAFLALVPKFRSKPDTELAGLLESLSQPIQQFLDLNEFSTKLTEIKNNTASPSSFRSRFFRWFDAFRLMKFVHFTRDHFYPDVPIEEAAAWLLEQHGDEGVSKEAIDLLEKYREKDRK